MAVNGQIPVSTLTKLSTPGYLLKAAAASFERLNKEATMTVGTTSSLQAYRSKSQQYATFMDYYSRVYNAGCTEKNGRKKFYGGYWYYAKDGKPVAAIPGTSNHGIGNTVDWQGFTGYNDSRWKKFAPLAKKHGWNNVEGKRIGEWWHWVYVEKDDKVLAAIKAAAARKVIARSTLKKIQGYLGVPKTGLGDAKTLAAWNKCPSGKPKVSTMAKCQRALGVNDDGQKGPITKADFAATCKAAK